MNKPSRDYDDASIRVLKGLEPVKKLPGMYTRTEDPLHIIQEVIDNCADEALAGFADAIGVDLLPEGVIRVIDNGRGIPVGIHPVEGVPTVQVVFTELHSGGKFDKAAGGAYTFSGGLHGVGVSVTNALSSMLRVDVAREGRIHTIEFSGGDVVKPLARGEKVDAGVHGTTVTVKPDPKYFASPDVPIPALRELLRSKAVLMAGLTATLRDYRKSDDPVVEVIRYANGMSDYLAELAHEPPLVSQIEGTFYAGPGDDTLVEGEGAQFAFSWYEHGDGNGRSYVNLIQTPHHGTHVAGLRAAIFRAVSGYIEHHALLPKGCKLTADDAFKSVRFILSTRMSEPAFQGQTKERLNSPGGVKMIEKVTLPTIEAWFNLNPVHAKAVAELVIRAAMSRLRAGKQVEKRKTSSVVSLPGKLAECESENPEECEIFLVEGDSAGGSAKGGRSKYNQAILPMRGKGLNTWELVADDAMMNEEVRDMATAFGIQPHTLTDEVDWSKLRYHRICILSDADVDGFHIQVLLLTLFLKHFPQLIARGHIYIACPPLYRLDAEASGSGKKRGALKEYAMGTAELEAIKTRLRREGYQDKAFRVSRFKGLGEMTATQLWETTLDPDTRTLLQVHLPDGMRLDAMDMFTNLMSKKQRGWRKDWMERRGHEVEAA